MAAHQPTSAFRYRTWLLRAAITAAVYTPAAGQTPVVRDSAGIRIVENPARAQAPVTFRLGTTPVLDLGGMEDNTDNEFNPTQGYLRAARLSNNVFAVIDVVRVHFFDARGKRITIAGRSGAGPEEFLYLTSICRTRGDTVVVSDSRNARLGILHRNGGIVRMVKLGEFGTPPFNACLDDGTLLLERSLPAAPGASRTARITRLRLDGSVVNTVGDFVFPSYVAVPQTEATVLAWQQRVYIGDTMSSEVRVYSPAGQLTTIIRSADPPVRITTDEAEALMRATIPNNVSAAEVAERMARMRGMHRATRYPAYQRLHVDPRGTLWVQDYPVKRPSPDGWTAFDAEGRLIGRLVIPVPKAGERRMEIISFGLDELLVRRQDADGFAHLTVFPIQLVRR